MAPLRFEMSRIDAGGAPKLAVRGPSKSTRPGRLEEEVRLSVERELAQTE